LLRFNVPHSLSASQKPPTGTTPRWHCGVELLTGGLVGHSLAARARRQMLP